MATGFRTIPSAIAQQAALAQLREIQNPNLALERELQKAAQLQQLQQQSPEGQLALQLKQAQLAQVPLQAQRQQYELDLLRAQLDPNYKAQQNAANIAFEVDRARQLGQVANELKGPQSLKFTETDTEIIAQDPFSSKEVSRTKKIPGTRYEKTPQGVFVFSDPDNPLKSTLAPGTAPIAQVKASDKMRGYDSVTGTFGIFSPDENGMFPEGVVPASQAPKPEKLKTPSTTQVDNLAGLDVLLGKIDEIKKTPSNIRASNVGWLDNILGNIQSITGIGSSGSVKQNEIFRTSVDALIGEYSFGRGGKSLTVNEKEILGKYLPLLTSSDSAFEARLDSFGKLVNELKQSKLSTLEDSGYNVSRFGKGGTGQTSPAPTGSSSIKVGRFTVTPN